MGTEAVKIKRAKYEYAKMEVEVHVLICNKFLAELRDYINNMVSDINANVRLINQGKEALITTVNGLRKGEIINLLNVCRLYNSIQYLSWILKVWYI